MRTTVLWALHLKKQLLQAEKNPRFFICNRGTRSTRGTLSPLNLSFLMWPRQLELRLDGMSEDLAQRKNKNSSMWRIYLLCVWSSGKSRLPRLRWAECLQGPLASESTLRLTAKQPWSPGRCSKSSDHSDKLIWKTWQICTRARSAHASMRWLLVWQIKGQKMSQIVTQARTLCRSFSSPLRRGSGSS